MSATVAAALKKIAVAILTDKKALKTVGGIILLSLSFYLLSLYLEQKQSVIQDL